MADTHEERLLNELLLNVRAADEQRSALDLEGRVLAAWDAGQRRKAARSGYRYLVIASAAAAALLTYLGVSTLRVDDAGPLPSVRSAPALAVASISPVAAPDVGNGGNVGSVGSAGNVGSDLRPPRDARSPRDQALEFVPLMPMTRQELAGPFQLVHVQLPRASLGAIAPPHEFPGQLVEADVLLGEDGMARAIRVSSNRSVSPWRSR